MMKINKGQAATEYVVIIGAVLLVTIPLLYYAMSESNVNIKVNKAEDVVNTLARAADTVYSIGPGTRKYVWIDMPKGVESYSLDEKAVLIKVSAFGGVSDIFAGTKANLIGQIPISKGQHRIKVEMLESGYVEFEDGDDNAPPIVIWTSPEGTINYQGVFLRATTDEYSDCKYNTEAQGDDSYGSMLNEFVGSALTHEKDMGLLALGNYVYYVRCEDRRLNQMTESAIINFTIVPYGENESYEPYPPVISLISPENNYEHNESAITFNYNVTDDSSILLCDLILDNATYDTDYDVERNITQSFMEGITYGNHTWNVNCTDIHGNENTSVVWNVSTNASADVDIPVVELIAPVDNTVRNYWLARFSYNVTDITSGIDYCDLHMFGVISGGGTVDWTVRDSPVQEDTTEDISLPLFKANYTWNISCVDDSYNANEGYSETWYLIVNISAGEEAFLDSCAGVCGFNGFSDGICENTPSKCNNYCDDCRMEDGDFYCDPPGPPDNPESDTCCCMP